MNYRFMITVIYLCLIALLISAEIKAYKYERMFEEAVSLCEKAQNNTRETLNLLEECRSILRRIP